MTYLPVLLGFCVFLYFGYRDDYRRDPKAFERSLMGPLLMLGIMILFGILIYLLRL